MKKILYLLLTLTTCLGLLAGCSFFGGGDDTEHENTTISDDKESTDDEKDDVSVSGPDDTTTTENDQSTTDSTENNETETTNPRDNVADDNEKEFTATGKYCGFIDSNSVEIELSDGSYCSFFVYEDEVRVALTNLNEEEMPEISFTYKAREGQINPEMIAVAAE